MKSLVELKSSTHQNLKIDRDKLAKYASSLHMMHLRVTELPKAILCFPVFISKASFDGRWTLSALTSFAAHSNVFMKDGRWDAMYQPLSLRTAPFYLMQAPSDAQSYAVGILEDHEVFSTEQGDPVFDDNGQPTQLLIDAHKLLESSVKEDVLTAQFIQKLEALNLLKEIDLLVQRDETKTDAIKGLYSINEDVLQGMSGAQLEELNKLGYLIPIHGMLMSLFQINGMVLRNNAIDGMQRVEHVRLEIARDRVVV